MSNSRIAVPAALTLAVALLIASASPGSAGEIAATQVSAQAPQAQDAGQLGDTVAPAPAPAPSGAVGFGWG